MFHKLFLVSFKSDKFTNPIFITLEMWKWEYNILNLPYDHKINDHVKIWVGEKFGSYRYFKKADITFLICYMISRNHVIRKSCDFICGFPLP